MTIDPRLISAVRASAARLGISALDLLTAMAYETSGTLDKDRWGGAGGRYLGLIQFGPEEQKQYGVKPGMPVADQVRAAERYLRNRGVKPGMGLLDIYSTINAGSPGHYNASDAANGGASGTVVDKVNSKNMADNRRLAEALLRSHPPSFGPPSSVGPGPGSGAIPDPGWPTNPHVTDQRGPFGTGGHLAPPTRNRIDDPLYPFNSFDHAPGYPAGPPPAALTHWLGPGLGTMRSFPDSLRDPAMSSGYYSDGRFVPTPQAPDRPIATVGPNPFSSMPIAPEALSSFDPRSWLSPEQRSITGIDAPVAPAAPPARPARRSALDDPTLPSPLMGDRSTPAPQLRGGLNRASYDRAPLGPFTPNSGPGNGDENPDRGPQPPLPSSIDRVPNSGSSVFADLLGRTPLYGPPASGWSEVPTTPNPVRTPQPFSAASLAPSVWPTANPNSSSALAAQLPPASAAGGKGILSGLFPDGASLSPGNGILGGLFPAPAGRSGSGGVEENNHSAWAQMLQELWLRRMQENAAPNDSNR